MEKKIYHEIEKSNLITIFGHVAPDGDCYGSAIGLKEAICATFPNKVVYCLGSGLPLFKDYLSPMDEVDDEVIKNSLAIVLDTGNDARVEDNRYKLAKKIIKIDHHVFAEKYADIEYIDENAVACAQILVKFIMNNNMSLTKKGAEALLLAITTDSGRFKYGQTNEDTFECAKFLVSKGVVVSDLYNILYEVNMNDIEVKKFVLNNFVCEDEVTYVKFKEEDCEALGIDINYASAQCNIIANVKGYPIWAAFAQAKGTLIRCELRSATEKYNVQKIAKKYGGGGHVQAAGCHVSSYEIVDDLIKDLKLLVKGEFKYVG